MERTAGAAADPDTRWPKATHTTRQHPQVAHTCCGGDSLKRQRVQSHGPRIPSDPSCGRGNTRQATQPPKRASLTASKGHTGVCRARPKPQPPCEHRPSGTPCRTLRRVSWKPCGTGYLLKMPAIGDALRKFNPFHKGKYPTDSVPHLASHLHHVLVDR